eukprot:1662728-Heterocapsa_arctica.AAC.1
MFVSSHELGRRGTGCLGGPRCANALGRVGERRLAVQKSSARETGSLTPCFRKLEVRVSIPLLIISI